MSASELDPLTEAIVQRYGWRVLSGPFAGMAYVEQAVGSALLPKLLGSYESELHALWARLLRHPYRRIINIGCGEGYYAVGLALHVPTALVVAFDSDPGARALCAQLAEANQVAERLRIAGECGVAELRAVLEAGSLIVCDCEGGEADLLRPDLVPSLGSCDLVVELHDFVTPGVSELVAQRFAATHRVTWIDQTAREPALFDQLVTLIDATEGRQENLIRLDFSESQKRLALSEFRPAPMRWAFLTPAHHPVV